MKTRRAIFLLIFAILVVTPSTRDFRVCAQTVPSNLPEVTILNLAGLKEKVTVSRDERGIPYIEATNEADLYMAQGYVTASDRLWQMDVLRRTVRGELSEIFGKTTASEDKRRRVYGFTQLSESMFANATPTARAALESYARGVNSFIDSARASKQLPKEFQILQYTPRPWTPADSLAIGKIFAEALSTTWTSDLLRAALADLPREKRDMLLAETSQLDVLVVGQDSGEKRAAVNPSSPIKSFGFDESVATLHALSAIKETAARSLERVGLYEPDRAVSNNWVVSGARSTTGKPLLANDPHLPSFVPSIWYMAHLSMPGMRVAGVTAPGAPGIILGHNEHIAWGATNLAPDVQDLYLEKFDKDNPRKYMTPGGWQEAVVRHEEIKIRKSFIDSATDSEFVDITVTRHGPIIFEKDGARYALQWTALDPKAVEFEAFFDINRANNWKEFQAALSRYKGPTQNFVYADVDGHIGYYGAGQIPIRKSGDGSVPYDGSTDAGDWTGFIPFDKLPHVYDPAEGIIVTANQRVVGRSYPYFLTHEWAGPYRARRIFDLLHAKQKLTQGDMRDIQADVLHLGISLFTRETVKLAGASTSASPSDAKWRETLQLFKDWDGRINIDSRAAPLATEMRVAFRRRLLEAAIGVERAKDFSWANEGTFLDRTITDRPADWLPKEFKDYLELLRAAETEARDALTKRIGPDDTKWTWGNYRPTKLRHPLAGVPLIGDQFAIAPFPQNGSGSVVNVGPYVSMRFIATLDNWDESRQGIALGESGDPSSKYFKDQLDDWLAVTPRVFPFSKSAVAKATQPAWILMPAK